MKQQEADVLSSATETVPTGLSLKAMLGVIPNWRLFDIATCFGLWRTEGMSKYELVAALEDHVMVTPSGLWSVLTRNERSAALKLAPVAMIEAKSSNHSSTAVVQARPYQFPRAILDLLDNAIFGGRLRKSHPGSPDAARDLGTFRSVTRPLLSILILLDVSRVAELSVSFGLSETQPLDVAVALERRNVRSRDVLQKLTTDELRLVAAAWTLTAPRNDLLSRLQGAMESQTTPAANVLTD